MTRSDGARLCRGVLVSAMLLAKGLAQVAPPFRLSFVQGQEVCQVVHFPERWITEQPPRMNSPRDAVLYKWLYQEDAVFRRTDDMGPGQVLISVESLDGHKSLLKFLLDMDASPVIREIGGKVWSSGDPVNIQRDLWTKLADQGLTLAPIGNAAHPKATKMEGTQSAVSPTHDWAAVFRWHGVLRSGQAGVPSKQLAPVAIPSHNDFSIEIVAARTEQKIVAARGRFRGVSTTHVSSSLGWITDRIFWMPLDNDLRNALICDAMSFRR